MRDIVTVYRAWRAAHMDLSVKPSLGQFFDVLQRYGEPHRHYHTLAHVAACLRFLDRTYPDVIEIDGASGCVAADVIQPEQRACLRLALIYHDIIYDVKSKTNEADSAAHARIQMSVLGFNKGWTDEVVRLILLTANHRGDPADRLGSVMIDTDMHVFAEPDRVYARYAAGIRREFEPAFGREPFLFGRRQFLSSVNPETIFVTPEMATEKSASQAAWNIAEESRSLA